MWVWDSVLDTSSYFRNGVIWVAADRRNKTRFACDSVPFITKVSKTTKATKMARVIKESFVPLVLFETIVV